MLCCGVNGLLRRGGDLLLLLRFHLLYRMLRVQFGSSFRPRGLLLSVPLGLAFVSSPLRSRRVLRRRALGVHRTAFLGAFDPGLRCLRASLRRLSIGDGFDALASLRCWAWT